RAQDRICLLRAADRARQSCNRSLQPRWVNRFTWNSRPQLIPPIGRCVCRSVGQPLHSVTGCCHFPFTFSPSPLDHWLYLGHFRSKTFTELFTSDLGGAGEAVLVKRRIFPSETLEQTNTD